MSNMQIPAPESVGSGTARLSPFTENHSSKEQDLLFMYPILCRNVHILQSWKTRLWNFNPKSNFPKSGDRALSEWNIRFDKR